MKQISILIAVTFFISSCTIHSGPVKLADTNDSGTVKRTRQAPPPESNGTVSLVFDSYFAADTDILSPQGISFGVDGTLYVCDRQRSSILRFMPDGTLRSRFSGFSSRVARLTSPIDVCSTSGMGIYVIDAANSQIIRFDRNLKNNFVAYSKDSDSNNYFSSFSGLSFDRGSGDLYVTDRDTGSIIRIDMLRSAVSSRGSFGSSLESLKEPAGLDVSDNGAIYVADRAAPSIAKLAHYGAKIETIGSEALEAPIDVAIMTGDRLVVADKRGIVVFAMDGTVLGTAGFGVDRDMSPRSLAFMEDKLYISDGVSRKILVYSVK